MNIGRPHPTGPDTSRTQMCLKLTDLPFDILRRLKRNETPQRVPPSTNPAGPVALTHRPRQVSGAGQSHLGLA